MFAQFWQNLRRIDWLLFTPIVFLMLIGLAVIYGISINPITPDISIFQRQLMYAVIGIVLFFILSSLNYRMWSVYHKIIYIAGVVILVFVLFFGVAIHETTGWISFGFVTLQPVEFAKIALIILLAKYFSDHARLFFLWRHSIISGALTILYVLLILRQPDLGSAMVLLGMWFLMLIVVGIPRKHLIIIMSLFIVAVIISWFFILEPYQQKRIVTFFNPRADILGVGYNVRQSIIAVGSGMIFGRGFALGSQSQLKFLPESESDFIFAVIAEEFGFIGALFVVGGILLILLRLLYIARHTTDNFAAYFCLGLASLLMVQSFINIGMNIGIAPVTGIPLPLLSAGGSSLVSFCIAFGIVSSIVADNRSMATPWHH